MAALCAAESRPPTTRPSAAFQDVLARVATRDPDSGAILEVRPRPDAPGPASAALNFNIHVDRSGGAVVVTLAARTMTADVYEQYRLAIDDALQAELGRQQLYRQQQAAKHARWVEAQKRKIPAVTGGRLRYGMSPEEVQKQFGTPAAEHVWQKAGGLTLVYPGMTLTFDGGLADAEVTPPAGAGADKRE